MISHKGLSFSQHFKKLDRFFLIPTIGIEHDLYPLMLIPGWREPDQMTYQWIARIYFIWGNRAWRVCIGDRLGFPAVIE